VTADEHPRPGATIEALAKLPPVFGDGVITAGSSSGITDGGAAVVVAGARAVEAGARLGELLAQRRRAGDPALLAISSDAAHYPPAWLGEDVNARLAPAIEGVDPAGAAATEAAIVAEGGPGLVCGMCGIEPTVLGLAALRAMGVTRGRIVSAATSADVGAGRDRTVGYLGARFAL
jgi:AmmeMemoRadiSam system protein B